MPYTYTAYGLTLLLPFACPVLQLAPDGAAADIVVTEGRVPESLPAPAAQESYWQAEVGRFLLRGGSRAGRFLAEGGQRVTYEPAPAAEEEMLAFFFLDMVLAALLRQRGLLVLHANAAANDQGQAVAVSGASGAGKSTTLAALLECGWAMLADDITALRLGAGGAIEALPGIPQMHLTEDSAIGLGKDIRNLPRHQWRRMKAAVPTREAMSPGPANLRALYLLGLGAGDNLIIRQLHGAQKFLALQTCIYGPLLPAEHPALFPLLAAVSQQVAIFQVERPAGRWTVDEVVSHILSGGS